MSNFSTHDSTVNSFYLAFYGRPADPAGMKYWSQQLANNNGDFGTIVDAFANSEEALTRFGNASAADRITDIYSQLFNRAPDTDGMAYWMNAINKGQASMADVALSILRGARGSDATLSQLRQQAADAFTAEVEASGTQYDGYASIEAARVLVRAVTPNATQADLDTLVKSSVSFADTATKTPKVVEAIAVNTTLLALFDTTRGNGDPVALAQALSDTAKAAAGDPVTLESLLRGGGMDKVLKVMPTEATLKDVVVALGKGGLPAAVEVVYPTKPVGESGPSPVVKLSFVSVSQGEFDVKSDNITNVKNAAVKFSYPGAELKNGEYFEYSVDGGKHWNLADFKVDTEAKVVTVKNVLLTGKSPLIHTFEFIEGTPATNVTNQFQLRLLDSAKKQLAFGNKEIIYDGIAPSGKLSFQGIDEGVPGDNTSTKDNPDVTFKLSGAGDDAIVQWRLKDAEAKWESVSKFDHGSFTLSGIDLSKSEQTIELRLIDAAGNVGDTMEQTVQRAEDEQLPELPQVPDPQQPQPPESNTPPVSSVLSIYYRINPAPTNSIDIFSMPGSIVKAQGEGSVFGFIDISGFSFLELGHGAPAPVNGAYMSGPFFGIRPNGLNLGQPLEAGFYEMGWKANTIATGTGTLEAKSFMFAGGHMNGQIYQEGFTVAKLAPVSSSTIYESNDVRVSSAFIVEKGMDAVIHTGGGKDVVVNNGGNMTIVYDAIKHADHDFIQGFGVEGRDKIQFEGDALAKVDRDGDLKLQWASKDTNGVLQLTEYTEAVDFVINGRILTEQVNIPTSETFLAINNALHNQELPATLLILARSTDGKGGILIHFEDSSVKNGQIDANELNVVATFNDGVPNQDDIVLIGIQGGI